jgi:hypothetical protein
MINPQKGIDLINNNSIIKRILVAVTIFQQYVPLSSTNNLVKEIRGETSILCIVCAYVNNMTPPTYLKCFLLKA